jgi:circadian clock protein KaiC
MSESDGAGRQLELSRLGSGIPGLDTVLLGGFVTNGLYIIQGEPGAGKTILSNQICYTHAAGGGRALYVTLLSEQHERLLANLERMSFFDASRIANEILYVSAFQLLERDGLSGLLTLLRREIVSHAASVLVLDGLVAAEAYATSQLELKKFVHELQTLAAAADCTMFLLTSSGLSSDAFGVRPEHTMVDGIITLRDEEYGWRAERDLLVRKFRGSDRLPGRHAMCITADGIKVWPRTEALPLAAKRRARDVGAPHLATGIAGLDAMIGGGLPALSSSVVMGAPGAGKTTIGLQFLAGSTVDEPGLLLGFYETPERLLQRAEGLAPALPGLVRQGAVSFQWHGETEDSIDRVAHDLLEEVRRRRVVRVVIDGLHGFEDMTVQPARIPHFFKALMDQLRELGATTLSTAEATENAVPLSPALPGRLTTLAENLIVLQRAETEKRMQRLISILKLRDNGFDTRVLRFTIEQGGLAVEEPGSDIAPRTGTAMDAAPGA